MDGVTILSQTEIMKSVDWYIIVIGILIGISIILFFGILIFIYLNKSMLINISSGIIVVAIILALVLNAFSPTEPTGRYRYEAVIDEVVSFTEIYKQYNVIEQRESIWILEDKENY